MNPLASLSISLFAALFLFSAYPLSNHIIKEEIHSKVSFRHGVASGDPLPNQVIIWTKITGKSGHRYVVNWSVASDADLQNVIKKGRGVTTSDKAYTFKHDVRGLEPGTTYYYQFECMGVKSPIGRTKTLPEGDIKNVNLAVVSCSNYEWGYFNPLAALAQQDSVDAVLHLGDYIYEYQISGYGDTTIGRFHEPPHELLTLKDYRTRYAQYRSTEAFQQVHQQHPFITIWDDHEISNDAYVDGAQNHQKEEGDFQSRKAAARQAYYEWMPIRENKDALYRSFSFGNLVDLIMLDERLAGRTAPSKSIDDATFQDSTRSMLGSTQRAWLFDQLKKSKATWKVIGNQVIFSSLHSEKPLFNSPINLDAWDGYPYEKKTIIDFLQQNQLKNIVFTTGDTHASWAFETPSTPEAYQQKGKESLVAVEFGTTSISSGNFDEYTSMDTVKIAEGLYTQFNDHLKFVNLHDHGYLLLKITPAATTAEWHYSLGDLRQPSAKEFIGKVIRVRSGSYELIQE